MVKKGTIFWEGGGPSSEILNCFYPLFLLHYFLKSFTYKEYYIMLFFYSKLMDEEILSVKKTIKKSMVYRYPWRFIL